MVVDAFQQVDDLMALETIVIDVVEKAFSIANGLQGGNEGDRNGEIEAPFDSEGQQHLGDAEFDHGDQEHSFDPVALEDAMKELYVSSKCTKLVATILLMNLCIIHGVNNKFANEFFALLRHHFLPKLNYLVTNYYTTRALTQKLGLDYENIHACPKRCILFWGDHKDDVSCPKCGSVWYKDVVNKVLLVKVLHHFPIMPRLHWLFKIPTMSKLMLWHPQNNSLDGLMRHPCDSKAWKRIHQKFPNFAANPHKVQLVLATNRVNPFELTISTWSTWLVTLLNYNVPP